MVPLASKTSIPHMIVCILICLSDDIMGDSLTLLHGRLSEDSHTLPHAEMHVDLHVKIPVLLSNFNQTQHVGKFRKTNTKFN
jgi:hypothetical protein